MSNCQVSRVGKVVEGFFGDGTMALKSNLESMECIRLERNASVTIEQDLEFEKN